MLKTRKKIYAVSSNATSSSRLCKSEEDFSHCKNLFGKANHALLLGAEEIYDSSLQRSELFLHLRCGTCKRHLKYFIALKTMISKGHRSYWGVTLRAKITEDFQSNTRLSGSCFARYLARTWFLFLFHRTLWFYGDWNQGSLGGEWHSLRYGKCWAHAWQVYWMWELIYGCMRSTQIDLQIDKFDI